MTDGQFFMFFVFIPTLLIVSAYALRATRKRRQEAITDQRWEDYQRTLKELT